jgi:hypothetical protein
MALARAFRLTLTYREGSFRLDAAAHLEKLTPASAPFEGAGQQAGSWIAIENSQGRMLYRRFIDDPRGQHEVIGEKDEISRVKIPGQERGLSLIVPDLQGAETFVVYGSETDSKGRTHAAKPIFKVSVQEVAALTAKGGTHGRR